MVIYGQKATNKISRVIAYVAVADGGGVVRLIAADAPGKTSAPLVEDMDEDSVTLSWGKPRDDGVDEVQGYVVEVLEKGINK